jgi:hypothetical protein
MRGRLNSWQYLPGNTRSTHKVPRTILPRARSALTKFFLKPVAYEFIVAWFALLGGAANAVRAVAAPEAGRGELWAVTVIVLWSAAALGGFIFTFCKCVASYWATNDATDGLVGAITCLQFTMEALHRGPPQSPPQLRITIYHPVGKDKLEQVIDYVGHARGGAKARRQCNARAGVIGAAYRSREARVANRVNDDLEAYIQELVNEWSYTEEEARALSPETRSAFAVPLQESSATPLIGILFLDAVTPKFFTKRQQFAALMASSAIARYAAVRYK